MHPAKSVIFFTVASGAGYGLFIWLAVLSYAGLLTPDPSFGLTTLGLSLGLITAGLLSSTFHLGHPERAWRALSQWRSSWLSREGVMAILTFIPLGIFAIGWIFFARNGGVWAVIGLVGAAMSLITVFTTSMIYASLKAVPAWHNIWTKLGYLILCLMSGALLALALGSMFTVPRLVIHMINPVMLLLALGLAVKLLYWNKIGRETATSTAESATGLGQFGKVSLISSPHDQDNYLLKEMGFRIARKHVWKLRILTALFGFILPFMLIELAWWISSDIFQSLIIVGAALFCAIGLACERWLFFAEAKHVVTLYYGEDKI